MNEASTYLATEGDDDARTSGVMVELEDLNAQSEKLQIVVDDLSERLSLVRRPSDPSAHAPPERDKPTSPLAQQVFSIGERLRDIQGRLIALIVTVDL